MSTIAPTMLVALQAVGTAAALTTVGVYLERRKFVGLGAKKTLAYLSRQVTIPALLFTKLVTCPSNGMECTKITDSFSTLWLILIWPFVVVSCGLLVGRLAAIVSCTPTKRRNAVIASCAFANSSGLVLTLLESIQSSLPETSPLLTTDPTALVSVYMIFFPVLQWGIGGWLLAPKSGEEEEETDYDEQTTIKDGANLPRSSFQEIDIDVEDQSESGAGSMTSQILGASSNSNSTTSFDDDEQQQQPPAATKGSTVVVVLLMMKQLMSKFLSHFLQPPVIAALMGLAVSAIFPLRSLFVDVTGNDNVAPLEWLFSALYSIGQAAVPVNMTILGINLSMAVGDIVMNPTKCFKKKNNTADEQQQEEEEEEEVDSSTFIKADKKLSKWSAMATVVGKMMIMPSIGIALALLIKNFMVTIPSEIEGAFYLVLMVVFITPTANNVMVMVELSGSGSQQDIASLIAWQYAVSPITLSIFLALVVLVASS